MRDLLKLVSFLQGIIFVWGYIYLFSKRSNKLANLRSFILSIHIAALLDVS